MIPKTKKKISFNNSELYSKKKIETIVGDKDLKNLEFLGLSYSLLEKGKSDILISNRFGINRKNKADCLNLLKEIKDETIKISFLDPQYRGVLDKMKYGNEGERQKKRSLLPQMKEGLIGILIQEIDRVLLSSGYLFLWVDKFHLCEGINSWIENTNFGLVDLITWNKDRMGMGYRTRRQSEYLIVLQKKPIKVKGTWNIHNIRDIWLEKIEIKKHAHEKPIGLIKKLIEATTSKEDFILDPCAGSYNTLKCSLELGRNFIGGDLIDVTFI